MKNNLTVSVVMITYNHEKYIRQAIEGVLMQKTDFDVELIIANDASPDNTDAVVKSILDDYQGKIRIRYYKHKQNKGISKNFAWALQQAQGKYIAICEGDDYWIDPYKLQKQVDLLESKNNIGLVATHNKIYLEKNETINKSNTHSSIGIYNFIDILYGRVQITTATVMIRACLIKALISELHIKKISLYDYIIWLFIAYKSDIAILKDYTTVYRVLEDSASHSKEILRIWTFKKELYFSVLYLIENVFHLEKSLKNKILLHKIKERYLLAFDAKDEDFIKYTLSFFKKNNEFLRYHLLKLSLKTPIFNKILSTYETLNLKLKL